LALPNLDKLKIQTSGNYHFLIQSARVTLTTLNEGFQIIFSNLLEVFCLKNLKKQSPGGFVLVLTES